ncbi:MAG: hypothetical protein PF436_02615 [Prolixibacteraceae bacterium]|jgi:Spy/CpxP family protein refolding chaperone|nr:hypothetical protein [Prolixibacteraceae bacterium]
MRRIISTTFLLVFMAVITMAQPPQGREGRQFSPEDMAKRQTEQMTEDLKLNELQVEKVSALNKKYAEKMRDAFQNAEGNREQMREKMQTLRTEKDTELKEILTEEQFKKYQEIEKERMERMQQRRENRRTDDNKRGQPRGGAR